MKRLILIAAMAGCADAPVVPDRNDMPRDGFETVPCSGWDNPPFTTFTSCQRACADKAAVLADDPPTTIEFKCTTFELMSPSSFPNDGTFFSEARGSGGAVVYMDWAGACLASRFDGKDEVHWAACLD
jgi:hypothetical protein